MNTSNWTGRAPRTVQEAFGPYTDRHVYDTRNTPRWHGMAWAAVCLLAAAGIGAMLSRGV